MPRDTESVALLTISDRAEVWGEIVSCVGSSRGIRLLGLLPRVAPARKIAASGADVVVLDSGPEGIEHLWCLKTGLRPFRLVLITDKIERRFVSEALKNGARGVFVRPLSAGELVPALSLIARGGFCLSAQSAQVLLGSQPERLAISLPEPFYLTPREEEILRLQAEGLGYKQIAARLNVSEHTVNNHLYAVRQKAGVHTAIEAINRVLRSGGERPPASSVFHRV